LTGSGLELGLNFCDLSETANLLFILNNQSLKSSTLILINIRFFLYKPTSYVSITTAPGLRHPALFGADLLLLNLGVNPSRLFNYLVSD